MTAEELLEYLKRLHDPASPERENYRRNKAGGRCPICGGEDPGSTYCSACYSGVKAAQLSAVARGVCRTCLARPIAPPKRRFRKVTQCLTCREADAQRHFDARLRKQLEAEEEG